jgi:hypothetical protein
MFLNLPETLCRQGFAPVSTEPARIWLLWRSIWRKASHGVCSVHIGGPQGSLDDLSSHGTVAADLVDEMLALTEPGVNQMTANGQTYRFTRSHGHIAGRQVVVFAPT